MSLLRALVVALVVTIGPVGCLGTIVGAAADVTVEVIKFPFKVVKGVAGVFSGDDESNGSKDSEKSKESEASNDD